MVRDARWKLLVRKPSPDSPLRAELYDLESDPIRSLLALYVRYHDQEESDPELAQRARAAEFGIEDLRGGTFTISNLGAVGGSYSTPIINHPESAILLLGAGLLLCWRTSRTSR